MLSIDSYETLKKNIAEFRNKLFNDPQNNYTNGKLPELWELEQAFFAIEKLYTQSTPAEIQIPQWVKFLNDYWDLLRPSPRAHPYSSKSILSQFCHQLAVNLQAIPEYKEKGVLRTEMYTLKSTYNVAYDENLETMGTFMLDENDEYPIDLSILVHFDSKGEELDGYFHSLIKFDGLSEELLKEKLLADKILYNLYSKKNLTDEQLTKLINFTKEGVALKKACDNYLAVLNLKDNSIRYHLKKLFDELFRGSAYSTDANAKGTKEQANDEVVDAARKNFQKFFDTLDPDSQKALEGLKLGAKDPEPHMTFGEMWKILNGAIYGPTTCSGRHAERGWNLLINPDNQAFLDTNPNTQALKASYKKQFDKCVNRFHQAFSSKEGFEINVCPYQDPKKHQSNMVNFLKSAHKENYFSKYPQAIAFINRIILQEESFRQIFADEHIEVLDILLGHRINPDLLCQVLVRYEQQLSAASLAAIIQKFESYGFNITTFITADSENLYHWLAKKGYLEILKTLNIKYLDNPKLLLANNFGQIPLMHAAANGHIEIVAYLLSLPLAAQAMINKSAHDGKSALSYAIEKGDIFITEYLLQNGASFGIREIYQAKDDMRSKLLQIDQAVFRQMLNDPIDGLGNRWLHQAVLDEDLAQIMQVLEWGADINTINNLQQTPLHLAIRTKNINIFKEILVLSDINAIDNLYMSMAIYAANYGCVEMLKEITQRDRLQLNKSDIQGRTPLMCAILNEHRDVINFLLEQPDLFLAVTDVNGKNALHHAVEQKNKAVVEELLKREVPLLVTKAFKPTAIFAAGEDIKQMILKSISQEDLKKHISLPIDQNENKLLHKAVSDENFDLVQQLVALGADVNSKNKIGITPVHLAGYKNNLPIFNFLIDNRADISVVDNSLNTTALYSSRKGVEVLKKVISMDRSQLNKQNLKGETPLIYCVMLNQPAVVEFLLLQEDLDLRAFTSLPNQPNDDKTAFIYALENQNIEIVQKFLNRNDLFTRTQLWLWLGKTVNDNGDNSLHLAAQTQDLTKVKQLLAWGSDVNSRNNMKQTPLHLSIINATTSTIFSLLLDNLADIKAVDATLMTMAYYAAHYGKLDILRLIIAKDPQQLNRPDHDCFTPLMTAVDKNQVAIIDELVEHENIALDFAIFRPHHANHGKTALNFVVELGYSVIVQKLLARGADISKISYLTIVQTPDELKKTLLAAVQKSPKKLKIFCDEVLDNKENRVLHGACYYNDVITLDFLLQNNVDIYAVNGEGFTAVQIAVNRSNIPIIDLLLKNNPSLINTMRSYAVEMKIGNALLYLCGKGTPMSKEDIFKIQGEMKVILLVELFKRTPSGLQNFMKEVDQYGCNVLHWACYDKDVVTVNWLLQQELDIKLTSNNGNTAAHFAIIANSLSIVKRLLEKDANLLHIKNQKGENLLDLAKSSGHREIVTFLSNYNALEKTTVLQSQKATENQPKKRKRISVGNEDNAKKAHIENENQDDFSWSIKAFNTAMTNAIKNKDKTTIINLIDIPKHFVWDLNSTYRLTREEGKTLLMYATCFLWYDVVEKLVALNNNTSHKANILFFTTKSNKISILHFAAETGDYKIVSYFLTKLATNLRKLNLLINSATISKHTPLHYAVRSAESLNFDVVKLLVEQGANPLFPNSDNQTPLDVIKNLKDNKLTTDQINCKKNIIIYLQSKMDARIAWHNHPDKQGLFFPNFPINVAPLAMIPPPASPMLPVPMMPQAPMPIIENDPQNPQQVGVAPMLANFGAFRQNPAIPDFPTFPNPNNNGTNNSDNIRNFDNNNLNNDNSNFMDVNEGFNDVEIEDLDHESKSSNNDDDATSDELDSENPNNQHSEDKDAKFAKGFF